MAGINIRERNGNILIGIKTEQFIQQLLDNTDNKGWSNFVVRKLKYPRKGHEWDMIPANKRQENDGKGENDNKGENDKHP